MKLLSPKFKCCIVDLLLLYCYVSIVLLIFYDYVNILSCMDDQWVIKFYYSLICTYNSILCSWDFFCVECYFYLEDPTLLSCRDVPMSWVCENVTCP